MSDRLLRRLAALDGAESAVLSASGTAAVACTMLALLRTGDHLLVSESVQPSTRQLCEHTLPALGIAVTFVDPRELRGWRRALSATTRAMFVESPVVATRTMLELRPTRVIAEELGLALIVDATAASPAGTPAGTPAGSHAADGGADVIVQDVARRLLDGEGGPLGAVSGTAALVDEVRAQLSRLGALPHPAAVDALSQALGVTATAPATTPAPTAS